MGGRDGAEPPDFLAIVGPTASGKSELAVALARRLEGEVISMDSRQVYRGMDIGTAKLPAAERAGVPHHGLDLIDPGVSYSAGRFASDARGWIADIRARGRVPILVGGTGFFLRALTQPIFGEPELDPARRRALRGWLDGRARLELERWVSALDPDRAALAARGGPQRVSRTLEVALLTGHPLSWWHRQQRGDVGAMSALVARVALPRAELDRRIELRVRAMLDAGLVDEVRGLLAAGHGADAPGMTGVGYREIALQIGGEITAAEAEARVVKATRAYARRQETWFRHQLPLDAVLVDGLDPLAERVERVAAEWARRAGGLPGEGGDG
ncbi:MAG: tRNA (adenosine(37)-N6)-dimethylallyltransferase MiaA [Gemmatimonadetes bacterium]|nr:tRNA (adenosine(37)-N6)-dimethylallyltransferase MiaA [Gemmatimonadota bacterium]